MSALARGARRALLGSTIALAATCASAAGAPPACAARVLSDLGWRLQYDDVADIVVDAGAPCDRNDLADAHARGDLRATLPRQWPDAQRDAALAALLDHPATHCAYAFRLGRATRNAVDRLVANPRWRFTALQLGWIGFGPGGPEADGWQRVKSFGRALQPSGDPSRAVQAFYTGSVRGECGLGRQVAQYASLLELFGDGFDRAFARDEIVIGTFVQLGRSNSILLGRAAGEFTRDGLAKHAAAQGPQAFNGLPGLIVHVFGPDSLDDANNQAENFVVYAVDAAAADALRAHGGFAHYNRINREIWELSRLWQPRERRGFERVLVDGDAKLRAQQPADVRHTLDRIAQLLDDPFYAGFRIYVHRQGVKPVAFHIARLLDRNPRTPFRIELALHNLHTTIYRRFVDQQLAACEAAAAP